MEFYCRGIRPVVIGSDLYLCILFCGCDFRCRYCYNKEILDFRKDYLTKITSIKKELVKFNADKVIFAGAEPCLQRQALLNLMRFCKNKDIKTLLYTNGASPNALNSVLSENLVDKVVFDIKSPFNELFNKVTRSETYFRNSKDIMKNIKKSLNLVKKSKVDYLIKTVIVPKLMYRKNHILKIADEVSRQNCSWQLSQFIPGETTDKRYKGINPLSNEFIRTLKKICIKAYPELDIV
ncbi:radical SAM protein [Candidatus Woesearchaeota archaeon]|nr:radical SAM protein [Candidatus Woesearchaeota archaeon]